MHLLWWGRRSFPDFSHPGAFADGVGSPTAQWGLRMAVEGRQRLNPGGAVGCAGGGLITFNVGMRPFWTILLLFFAWPACSQGLGSGGWELKRIDSAENWVAV